MWNFFHAKKEEKKSAGVMWAVLNTILQKAGALWIIVTAVIGSLVVGAAALTVVWMFSGSTDASLPASLSQKKVRQGSGGTVALVQLHGVITEDGAGGGFSAASGISALRVGRMLDQLAADESVKAVVLRINSPGGAVVASDELFRKVQELRKSKVVVASLGDVAASGGYYIAAGTDAVVANPSTVTGSIGVIAQFPKLAGLYEKLGVEMRVVKSGQFKDIGSESRDLTPQEVAILDSVIETSYSQFVQAIVQGRGLDEQRVRTLADGRIYSGAQAKEVGLVDALGDLETAIDLAGDKASVSQPTVIEYSDQSFWQTLLESRTSALDVGAELRRVLGHQPGMYYLWLP